MGKIVLKKDGIKYAKLKAWKHEQNVEFGGYHSREIYKDVSLSERAFTLAEKKTLFVQEIDKISAGKDPLGSDASDCRYIYKVLIDNQTGYILCYDNPYEVALYDDSFDDSDFENHLSSDLFERRQNSSERIDSGSASFSVLPHKDYETDLWKVEDIIESGDKTWTVRTYRARFTEKHEPQYLDETNETEGELLGPPVNMLFYENSVYEKPDTSSKLLAKSLDEVACKDIVDWDTYLSPGYEVLAVTEESETLNVKGRVHPIPPKIYDEEYPPYDITFDHTGRWVKVRMKDGSEGWIFDACLHSPDWSDRIRLLTPDVIVKNDINGGNYGRPYWEPGDIWGKYIYVDFAVANWEKLTGSSIISNK